MTPFMAFGGLVVAFPVSGVASDPSLNGKVLIVEDDLTSQHKIYNMLFIVRRTHTVVQS